MTKEIGFDLDFLANGLVHPISSRGDKFLADAFKTPFTTIKDVYRHAVSADLHARFETAEVRDFLTQ
jgi:hypothetical protein